MDIPKAGELTGLVAVLWPIFRIIATNLPNPHSNLREELNTLHARTGQLHAEQQNQRESVRLLERRVGDAELDIAHIKRERA